MEQQQTAPTKTSGPQYGQAFIVFRNPGPFSLGSRWSDQGVLVIRDDKLMFADVKGRSFEVPLDQAVYGMDKKHHLRVTLANGDKWAFVGMFGNMVVKPETEQLAARYGIDPKNIGGVRSYVESLKASGQFFKYAAIAGVAMVESARVAGDAASVAAGGVAIGASAKAEYESASMVLEGYQKVDEFVLALRAHGLKVPIATPSLQTIIAYVGVDFKKNMVFIIMSPFFVGFFGFFLAALIANALEHLLNFRGTPALILLAVLEVSFITTSYIIERRWRWFRPYYIR